MSYLYAITADDTTWEGLAGRLLGNEDLHAELAQFNGYNLGSAPPAVGTNIKVPNTPGEI